MGYNKIDYRNMYVFKLSKSPFEKCSLGDDTDTYLTGRYK